MHLIASAGGLRSCLEEQWTLFASVCSKLQNIYLPRAILRLLLNSYDVVVHPLRSNIILDEKGFNCFSHHPITIYSSFARFFPHRTQFRHIQRHCKPEEVRQRGSAFCCSTVPALSSSVLEQPSLTEYCLDQVPHGRHSPSKPVHAAKPLVRH